MEIAAVNTAFQDREEPFDGVGMGLSSVCQPTRPFLSPVIDGIVPSEALTNTTIGTQLVGHQAAFGVSAAENHIAQSGGSDVINLVGARPASALDESDDRDAISAGPLFLPSVFGMQNPGRATFPVYRIGLVALDDLAFAADRPESLPLGIIASQMRWPMNQPVLKSTPKTRQN